ncbi:hypothetical protein O1L55_23840 [Streptomyces albulus]|nr:hypothetical protein [Streptomyces noursei]
MSGRARLALCAMAATLCAGCALLPSWTRSPGSSRPRCCWRW